jgi:hypothetical protein
MRITPRRLVSNGVILEGLAGAEGDTSSEEEVVGAGHFARRVRKSRPSQTLLTPGTALMGV